ncbi:MAG: YfhO family protein [Acidobacteriota bacterium]
MSLPIDVDRRVLAAWALFASLSLIFFWQPLWTGEVLVPTNPRIYEPWSGADDTPYVSNDLMSDTLLLTYPWRLYAHQVMRDGEIPFWNPYIFSGYPHLAALQANALYPPVVLFDLWRPIAGIAYAMALHLALAGGLMFSFLRRLGLGMAAATFGGVLFELNGFFLVRMSAPSYVFSGIWTPLLLIGIRDLIEGRGWRASWKVVLPTCLAILGGHPQIVVLMLGIGGAYTAYLTAADLWKAETRSRTAARLLSVGLATGLGVALAAVQLVPFLELVQHSERSPAAFEEYRSLALPLVALTQAVLPDIFGHPVDHNYFLGKLREPVGSPAASHLWRWNYCGQNLFIGITPLLFAAFALLRARSREVLFFSAIFATSLMVVLGSPLVLPLFYELVPSFQFSRADRIIYAYMLAVCVLAAFGYAAAERAGVSGKTLGPIGTWLARLVLVLPVLASCLELLASTEARAGFYRALGLIRQHGEQTGLHGAVLKTLTIAVASLAMLWLLHRLDRSRRLLLAAVVLLAVVPLMRFGWRFNPVQPAPLLPASPVIQQIASELGEFDRIARFRSSGLRPNLGQPFGFFDVNGASAASLASYTRIIHALDDRAVLRQKSIKTFYDPEIFDSHLLDFLGTRLVIANRQSLPLPRATPTLDPASNGNASDGTDQSPISLYRNPEALPRFFLVDRVETYTSELAAVQRLISTGFDPATTALVSADAQLDVGGGGDGSQGQVEILSYLAHEITLRVRSTGRRLLVSSEVDYPGWEVEVNGSPSPKIRVNTAFRGVALDTGEHLVRFHFVPRSFHLGLAISLAALAFMIGSLRSPERFDRWTRSQR